MNNPHQSTLGQRSSYKDTYDAGLLFPIPRKVKREAIGIQEESLPFQGWDLWHHYEVSWLNPKGKPMVAIAVMRYDCTSPNIIESKSMKLYFNSLNQTHFESVTAVQHTLTSDLSQAVAAPVEVQLLTLSDPHHTTLHAGFEGICLDALDIECNTYTVTPDHLTTTDQHVQESLYSNLLKSNCLVTEQPDWGSVLIQYEGPQIRHEGLLQYLVSFRQHNEFHEQCIERIFTDIMQYCQPSALLIDGRYTRRGGIDINPCRSTHPIPTDRAPQRLVRQ